MSDRALSGMISGSPFHSLGGRAMRRAMFAAVLVVLGGALPTTAQDPRPAVQPVRPMIAAPARIAALEEEVETLEAHRDVKKAHVKAAELGVQAAELGLDRLTKAHAKAAILEEEYDRAKLKVKMAKVQVEIRMAEMKEVEVKIKHAKKRLEEAKGTGVRPGPVPA